MLLGFGKKKIGLNLPAAGKSRLSEIMKVDKDGTMALFKAFCEVVKRNNIEINQSFSIELSRTLQSLEYAQKIKLIHKEALAKLYVSLSSDLKNIYNLAKNDPKIEQAWLAILKSDRISSKEIEKIIGRKIDVATQSYWTSHSFVEVLFSPLNVEGELTPFSSYRYKADSIYWFNLLPFPRKVLVDMFMGPEILLPQIIETLPDDKSFYIENFENSLVNDLSFLSGLAISGSLRTSGGALTAAKIKGIKKNFFTKLFVKEKGDYPLDRIELLANAFSVFESKKGTEIVSSLKPDIFAKFIIEDYPKEITATRIATFIPLFKGFTKVWADSPMIPQIVEILSGLIKPSSKGWMSMHNFKLRFLCMPVNNWTNRSYNGMFTSTSKQRHALKRKSEAEVYRSAGINWFEEVDFPFVIHWIKFLCATGILEIAYPAEKDSSEEDKLLEEIRYIRLTPLGRYVFGFDNEYESQEVTTDNGIEVDERTGIITLSSADSPYSFFLSQFTDRISNNRYRLTPKSIMKGCDTKKEVEDRIKKLVGIIEPEEAVKLENIFSDVRKRINCVQPVKNEFVMIRLRSDRPELTKLIFNNKEIRENVILAEKSVVLVKREFYQKFLQICKGNGYLL